MASSIRVCAMRKIAKLGQAARHHGQLVIRAFNSNKASWVGFVLIVLSAILAPWIAPHDPAEQFMEARLAQPSAKFLLGTDDLGRDILSRLLYGGRLSLTVGIVSTLIAVFFGSIIGALAGFYGGLFELLVMQTMDVLLAFPSLILGLVIVAMLGPGLTNLTVAIAITSVPAFARNARAPTLIIREREFILAGRTLGYRDARLIVRHILPNIAPDILVLTSMLVGTSIRVESSFAFIGLGLPPPTPTWGLMIRSGFENILDSPWLVLWPSVALLICVFSLNLLGDGLRDAIDPKLRGEA
ncbi:ABC transporter permease [Bradyrhizobium arachidis]|uniref:ABC transporter permease n=1 Tax=Bradyrhizobium arachidis TaxID=858423 RepID=UPI002163421F|nr:ABC transporter permease [Bradyrhizobium arachidis]